MDMRQPTSRDISAPASSSSKSVKKDGKSKVQSVPGQRYQCPNCPKNFSRIENLTRHMANHEEVSKFVCLVCRKRFTRSDLLNRHRRIHNNAQNDTPPKAANSRSAPEAEIKRESLDPQSFQEGTTSSPADGRIQIMSQNGIGNYQSQYSQNQHPSQLDYQNSTPQDNIQQGHPSMIPGNSPAHGLNSLMEAALAPQERYAFTPAQNLDPSLWNGFMLVGDNSNSYMGSYDADISWTLSSFHSESPPGNYLDADMMQTGMAGFVDDPYQYPAVSYRQDDVGQLDATDAEDEDTNDWPDKVARPDSSQPQAPSIVPLHLLPVSWQTILGEARASGLSLTTIRPFQLVNSSLRASILHALDGPHLRNPLSKAEISDTMFPPAEALDFFLRLYIRYVHPRFPVLHLPTFSIYSSPPLLLAAMMFLGSSHSRMDRGRFSRLFYDHLRLAVLRSTELDPKYLRSADNILTSFLLCLVGTWSGSKQAYEFSEGGRGILIAACRRSRLLDCRPTARVPVERFQRPGLSQLDAIWLSWIETEKRKRLGLCVYIFDCQYPALFNNQPYVSKAETTNCVFPCPVEYWEASSAASWKLLVGGQADGPLATYYLPALNACLLRKWVKPPPPATPTNSSIGSLVLVYAIHTHIFEWRQATSMLNPTGLVGAFGPHALPMGEALKTRRQWLVDALDSWGECYGPESPLGGGTAATLLQRLGYVALDVSLSDMHLVAGRSQNANDGDFAEENLKHWANSEMATSTMTHVYNMLELCHHLVSSGTAADASYETAVCLFTGGIVCWAFAKLKIKTRQPEGYKERDEVRRAAAALRELGCWRMCSMFGRILNKFDVPKA